MWEPSISGPNSFDLFINLHNFVHALGMAKKEACFNKSNLRKSKATVNVCPVMIHWLLVVVVRIKVSWLAGVTDISIVSQNKMFPKFISFLGNFSIVVVKA